MKSRSHFPESPSAAAAVCWQREAPTACLRVELPSGEMHLFSYQHFIAASFRRDETGAETLRISFSSHELEVDGRGLRDLLLGLQDFGVKWLRTAPERYAGIPADTEGVILSIRISVAE